MALPAKVISSCMLKITGDNISFIEGLLITGYTAGHRGATGHLRPQHFVHTITGADGHCTCVFAGHFYGHFAVIGHISEKSQWQLFQSVECQVKHL